MATIFEVYALQSVTVVMLTLARVGSLVTVAPLYSSLEIPVPVRVFLTVTLALLVAPMQFAAAPPAPATLIDGMLLIVNELLLGAFFGMGVVVLMAGIQIAGLIAGQLSGMSLADVFNPGFDADMPLLSHLLTLLMVTVYLLIGGHRLLLGGLLQTFEVFPLGQVGPLNDTGTFLVDLLGQSLGLGIRTAAPVMTALILANVMLGLIGKTLPQLNVMTLGFGLTALITLGMMAISMTTVVWMFEERYPLTIDAMLNHLRGVPLLNED